MAGVLVNAIAIVMGSTFGLCFKGLVSEELSRRTQQALGYCVLILGIKMALKFEHVLLLISCVSLGGLLGYALQIEANTEKLAGLIHKRLSRSGKDGFVEGFSIASILFCTGAMAIVGSINSGILGNHEVLFAKALLDGMIGVTFAAVYGIGVAFSALPVLIYQGSIAALASKLSILANPMVLNEVSGVGGVLLLMIGSNLAGLKKVPVGDYLPAIPLAMAAAAFMASRAG